MQTKKGMVKYFILIISIAVFIGVFIFSFNDINAIFEVLREANYKYVLYAFLFLLIYIVLLPISMLVILYGKKENIKFIDAYNIVASEFFFRGVTPFNAGGEPFQIYGFNCCNVKTSRATSVVLMNFAVFQVLTNILCLLAFGIYYNKIYATLSNYFYIIIIGFVVNIFTMVFLFFAMSKKIGGIAIRFCNWLGSKKLFKRLLTEKRLASLDQYFLDMANASHELIKQWPIMLLCGFVKLISLLAYNAIPYFVFKAIGVDLNTSQIVFVTMMTIFTMTMLIWVPTPGASGGIEFVFTIIFASLGATGAKAVSGMLIWRLLTYYFLLIYGFICYLVFTNRRKKYENRNIY